MSQHYHLILELNVWHHLDETSSLDLTYAKKRISVKSVLQKIVLGALRVNLKAPRVSKVFFFFHHC